MTRKRALFDFDWLFHKGDFALPYAATGKATGGLTDCWEPPAGVELPPLAFRPKEWHAVDLPHDFVVEEDFSREADLSHGFLPVGVGFYRKEFRLAAEERGKKVWIEFDGIYRQSTVWVNGHCLGTHPSGYTSFHYDLTDLLRYGEEGTNVILVRADGREFEGWWYEGCGIYRHVWLVVADRLHVAHWGTYVTTPQVGATSAAVSIRTTVANEHATDRLCQVISTLVDAEGEPVASVSACGTIPAGEEREFAQDTILPQPQLWSPDHPYLYRVLTAIKDGGQLVDTYETPLGIRTFEFTADRGFSLNGQPLFIKGTCNHQDFAGVGVALPDALIEYKIWLLKEMGCNAYRSSHHPPTPELLDICDRLGMMVMDENRHLDVSPEGIADLQRMLYRDRNHPCIVLWSMENEEDLEGTVMGARMVRTLVQTTHRIDPTRPATAAMCQGWNTGGYSDELDVVGYNYGHNKDQDVSDHAHFPKRKIIGSESASGTTTRGIYEIDKAKGYLPADGSAPVSWGCTPERAWTDVARHPYLTGVFIWTGFDYRGEPTPYGWPCISSHFGVMDTCGFLKDDGYYLKANWTTTPMVHLFPHWNWPGREGQEVAVWAYANCESVELFLNGQSLGEKAIDPVTHLIWQVPYAPGELLALGRKGGQVVAQGKIATTGPAARVQLLPDRATLRADRCDVVPVRVAILDVEGRVVPVADNEVAFQVSGPGRIIGVGNGDPSSHEPDKASRRRAFCGRCLALVQSGDEPGEVVLQATSPGLENATVTIVTQ